MGNPIFNDALLPENSGLPVGSKVMPTLQTVVNNDIKVIINNNRHVFYGS